MADDHVITMTQLENVPLTEHADESDRSHHPAGPSGTHGLAFSGGGIRSAAFSSGVLRRLLQKNTKLDYLSCVSGGGYTGTAYLDWKYRHEMKDDPSWHKDFFAHMRSHAGLLCNWQKPLQGIMDSIVMLVLLLLVTIVMPFIVWFPPSFPIAYAADKMFGKLLRFQPPCAYNNKTRPPGAPMRCRPNAPVWGSLGYQRSLLFSITLALFVIFHVLAKYARRLTSISSYLSLLSSVAGLFFSMTFIPWFIDEFLSTTPEIVQLGTILFSILIWYFFPVLRRKASLVLVVYIYAYIVYWRVYQLDALGFGYRPELFNAMLLACGIVMTVSPIVGMIQQRAVFAYNRWRLQRSFYHPSGIGRNGCRGIGCFDWFLGTFNWKSSCCKKEFENAIKPLTMQDLVDIRPHYISNIVVNEWRKEPEDNSYALLTISPTEIERLDTKTTSTFTDKLAPSNVKMSEAMATSAAAVAQHMGMYDHDGEGFKHLQTILGISMGSTKPTDMYQLKNEGVCLRLVPFVLGILQALPLVVFPVVSFWYYGKLADKFIVIGVFTYLGILFVLAIIAIQKTGSENPGIMEKVVRWCLIHLPFSRFFRDLMSVDNIGPMPPAILRLSDGGHYENLALLPLLKKRLKKIVVANGGHAGNDDQYAEEVIYTLKLARETLNCCFLGLTGRDVIEDIRELFSRKEPGAQPRSYRFRVDYYEKECKLTEGVKVGEGEILLLAPRHPSKGVKSTAKGSWTEFGLDLESGQWGPGPELEAEEADRLTWCCCACCHGNLQGLSDTLLDTFPQHTTANQFFTPDMFSAYHREGYHACVEGMAAEFLSETQPVTTQPEQ